VKAVTVVAVIANVETDATASANAEIAKIVVRELQGHRARSAAHAMSAIVRTRHASSAPTNPLTPLRRQSAGRNSHHRHKRRASNSTRRPH
jgi:hypothetical protein